MELHRKFNLKIFSITGAFLFVFYFYPVFKHHFFIEEKDRLNDHLIFKFPLEVFQTLLVISYGSIIPYVIQIVLFLITWLITYLILRRTT